MIDKLKTACFSGHRKLPRDLVKLRADLEEAVTGLIDCGVEFFENGGAIGFDLLAAETVLRLKESYPHIKLIMILPCPPEQQSLKWSESQKRRYFKILEQADKLCVLSAQYTSGCMLARNRRLANDSAYLICYLRKNSGGTFYTFNYAKSKGLQIFQL